MKNLTTYTQYSSASNKGIALLIAVIFTSVMLAIGISLSSLGYKQIILSSTAGASQKAFYAADTALECVLSAVYNLPQSTSLSGKQVSCNGNLYSFIPSGSTGQWKKYTTNNMQVSSNVCARAVIYWPQVGTTASAYVYTTGYNNVNCSITPYTTTQGLQAHF